jgi:hypothetical protein
MQVFRREFARCVRDVQDVRTAGLMSRIRSRADCQVQ